MSLLPWTCPRRSPGARWHVRGSRCRRLLARTFANFGRNANLVERRRQWRTSISGNFYRCARPKGPSRTVQLLSRRLFWPHPRQMRRPRQLRCRPRRPRARLSRCYECCSFADSTKSLRLYFLRWTIFTKAVNRMPKSVEV